MSYDEFYNWMNHYQKEPFQADRTEIQLARLTSYVLGFGGSKTKPDDFMVSQKEEKKQKTDREKSNEVLRSLFFKNFKG